MTVTKQQKARVPTKPGCALKPPPFIVDQPESPQLPSMDPVLFREGGYGLLLPTESQGDSRGLLGTNTRTMTKQTKYQPRKFASVIPK